MDPKKHLTLKANLHKKYLTMMLNRKLPVSSLDSNRAVLMYFTVSGLEVLNEIHSLSSKRKEAIIEWIYSLQVQNEICCGFQDSTTLNTKENKGQSISYKTAHIANTYVCLATLLILGDDLSRVNRQLIIQSLKVLQLPDGSFKGAVEGVENDMRFVYCAACISYILKDWSGINVELMIDFILNSISYEGGIGQGPGLEAHSGSTFCAVAALSLSNNLDRLTKAQLDALRRWLLFRYDRGFNGRCNKPIDTCYTFWTGASLQILDSFQFITDIYQSQYVLMTQDRTGGLSKYVNCVPDHMHTYLGLAGLSLMNFDGLNPMFAELNITQRTFEHLKNIHSKWN